MANADAPAAHNLLPLLERLANVAISAHNPASTFRLEGVALEPGSVTLRLQVRGVVQVLEGVYPVQLAVHDSTLERTRCAMSFPRAPGVGRLLGLGLKVLPRRLLNDALAHVFGGAIAVEGEAVVIDHRALLAAVRGKGRQPGGA